ncbi:MAG: hypothetical protein RJA36_1304 [Pseudomonadota bacterium]|jgi:hypothetical protein
MTQPVRERVLAALTAAVGGVYRMPTPEDSEDMPLTFVQASSDEVTTDYEVHYARMPVAVARAAYAASPDQAAQRAQAHAMLAELVAQLWADPTLGGLCSGAGLQLVGQGIELDLGRLVFAEVSLVLPYRTVRGDATALPP